MIDITQNVEITLRVTGKQHAQEMSTHQQATGNQRAQVLEKSVQGCAEAWIQLRGQCLLSGQSCLEGMGRTALGHDSLQGDQVRGGW